MKILILQHEENCGPGRVGRWFADAGHDLTIVHGPRDAIPADLDGVDALVILGGSMNADSDADHPWLTPVKARIREAVDAGIPVLGLCLGMQLMAVTLAGQVTPRGHLTLGLTPFLRTEAGRQDPLFGALVDPVAAVHYNVDHVSQLPEGAVVLAHAPDGQPTAVRFADKAWGTQFHPEVDAAGFTSWTLDKNDAERPQTPLDLAVLTRAVVDSEETLERTWRPVAEAFLAQLG